MTVGKIQQLSTQAPALVAPPLPPEIRAISPSERWDHHTIRGLERNSIREFVTGHKDLLTGRVLDFGAGKEGTCLKPQPYRTLIDGEYDAWDLGDMWPIGDYDAILCTQVLQYVPDPPLLLHWFHGWLKEGGYLVMTYPTSWDEVEDTDLWRFTKVGMEKLLLDQKFEVLHHERRAEIELGGFKFPLGYGVVARRRG